MQHLAPLLCWCTSHDFLASSEPCPDGHLIRSNLLYLSPSKQGMNFYLIKQMTSAHLTSNSMLCDNTFLCPRRLFSSPIRSWLCRLQPRKATKLSVFQPPGVYKKPGIGQDHQSHLCWCLNNTSPRLAFTSTSAAASGCSIPRREELVPVSPCSCPPRGPQLFHSQVNFTSQARACQSTFDFHSQVNSLSRSCLQVHLWLSLTSQLDLKIVLASALWLSLTSQLTLKIVLASALLTFIHKSPHLSRTCLQVHFWLSLTSHFAAVFIPFGKACHCGTGFFCGAVILLLRAWYCHQVPHILLCRMPTVGWVLLSSWRSSCSATAYWCHTTCWTGHPNGLGSTLPIFFVAQVLCSIELVLVIRFHLY